MSALRKHAWAVRFTLVAYLAVTSVGAAMGGLCRHADAHARPDCDHSGNLSIPGQTASTQEHDHHSRGEKPSSNGHCIHCSCQFCAVTGADHIYAVNARHPGSRMDRLPRLGLLLLRHQWKFRQRASVRPVLPRICPLLPAYGRLSS